MPTFRYAKSQVVLHWVAALVIALMLVTGTFILSNLPNTPDKIGMLRIHMMMGSLVAILILTRVVLGRMLPAPPATDAQKKAHLAQIVLNLTVLLLAASGSVLALQSGLFDAVFGSGALPEDFKVFTARQVHGWVAKAVMALVALHVASALFHQFFLKDGELARMTFRK
ncbi:MAG: hypothetical protein BWK72_11765 [Rhodoferax ferrireducens]|uniref:Cytochrome b561 bacterial/Ni-hydrogenase domain-containing protein n=1 Tax=Rhodoferax ferrireducens TaxID=192843 RepID=A0A1W9KTB4_9BURK|nr:MAG: hypothetical protein BWK72_11765 [Rhodoferax ferrireducens]